MELIYFLIATGVVAMLMGAYAMYDGRKRDSHAG